VLAASRGQHASQAVVASATVVKKPQNGHSRPQKLAQEKQKGAEVNFTSAPFSLFALQ
jgi:hypothetical protein